MMFSFSICGELLVIYVAFLSMMEQIKKMIVYAVDQAVKDLKALLNCA